MKRTTTHRPTPSLTHARVRPLAILAVTLLAVIAAYLILPGSPARSGTPRDITPRDALLPQELHTIQLFESASQSVAFLTTLEQQRDRTAASGIREREVGTGSAFIWDDQGHLVTNSHVVLRPGPTRRTLQPASRVTATLSDGSTYDANIVGLYLDKDLAVLQIQAPTERLRPIPIGESESLLVGQSVYAIGNPFGLDQTLTTGIVSALGRSIQSLNGRTIDDVIQTDAAINPGNSGGPLLDSAGRLIGVNTQIASASGSSSGVGFAIPVDTVNRLVPQLIAFGEVRTPTIGVFILDPRAARQLFNIRSGVAIRSTVPDGPADLVGIQGLRPGPNGGRLIPDIIIAIDDDPIENIDDLFNALEEREPGQRVQITLLRNATERIAVELVLAQPN